MNLVTMQLPDNDGTPHAVRLSERNLSELARSSRHTPVKDLTFGEFQTLAAICGIPYEVSCPDFPLWIPCNCEDSESSRYADDMASSYFPPDDARNPEPWEPPQVADLIGTEPIGIPANPETVRQVERRILERVISAWKDSPDTFGSWVTMIQSQYGL